MQIILGMWTQDKLFIELYQKKHFITKTGSIDKLTPQSKAAHI